MKRSPLILLVLIALVAAPALAKPFLRVDIRNGMKVPPRFVVSGKTWPGCRVTVEVSSWDGFGGEIEAPTDNRGRFHLPVAIEGKTVTTHVDIIVRSYDLRRDSMKEVKRYVILQRRHDR